MTIKQIKEELLNYTDFYGGDIPASDSIKKANSRQELAEVIESHRSHLENMLCDANIHLDELKKRCGLSAY